MINSSLLNRPHTQTPLSSSIFDSGTEYLHTHIFTELPRPFVQLAIYHLSKTSFSSQLPTVTLVFCNFALSFFLSQVPRQYFLYGLALSLPLSLSSILHRHCCHCSIVALHTNTHYTHWTVPHFPFHIHTHTPTHLWSAQTRLSAPELPWSPPPTTHPQHTDTQKLIGFGLDGRLPSSLPLTLLQC